MITLPDLLKSCPHYWKKNFILTCNRSIGRLLSYSDSMYNSHDFDLLDILNQIQTLQLEKLK